MSTGRRVLVLVALLVGCSQDVTHHGPGEVVYATELATMELYTYDVEQDPGGEVELTDCSVARSGVVTATVNFVNPFEDAPVMLIFGFEGVGIEHLRWNVPPGPNELAIDSSDFSDEGIDERLVQALSLATLQQTKCFVSIVSFGDEPQLPVQWPNSSATLMPTTE